MSTKGFTNTNTKFIRQMLSTYCDVSTLYAHENQNFTDNHIMQIFKQLIHIL